MIGSLRIELDFIQLSFRHSVRSIILRSVASVEWVIILLVCISTTEIIHKTSTQLFFPIIFLQNAFDCSINSMLYAWSSFIRITHYIFNITMIQEIYFASPLKLHPSIGIQILQSVLFTFPMVLTTRIVQRSGPS